jgi:hypothetical protein
VQAKEAPIKAQTPPAAAAEQRCGRRESATIDPQLEASAAINRGRFSTGHEQRPEAPDKHRIGRYSRGLEQLPDSPAKSRVGRFSSGIEALPATPGKLRRGSFADGYPGSG